MIKVDIASCRNERGAGTTLQSVLSHKQQQMLLILKFEVDYPVCFLYQRDWRGAREAEGAPLLREYTPKAYRGFESLPLRHFLKGLPALKLSLDISTGF